MEASADPAPAAAALIEAINARDAAALEPLLDERSQVVTGRSVHEGAAAVAAWAEKAYDHLSRRYAVAEMRIAGERVLAVGQVEYVWSEGGEVADSTPVALVIELERGRLRRLEVHDDPAAALAGFDA